MAWLETGSARETLIRIARPDDNQRIIVERSSVYVIGIDPHKGSHTAAVVGADERVRAEITVAADRVQVHRLLEWAEPFTPRRWAVEGARGVGALLAGQLVAAGEDVVDVAPRLAARVRYLDNEATTKTDGHDARAVAIAGLRHRRLRPAAEENETAEVLRLLSIRRKDLVAQRTRIVCRLHALLARLVEGGTARNLSAERAGQVLRRIHPSGPADIERKRQCSELLAEIRRLDGQLDDLEDRIRAAVEASDTTVTEVYGVGPIVAALILGHTGDVGRFATPGHYARYNATAPIDASTAQNGRHRLNPRGNRQLNHAIHIAAVVQLRHDTPGRAYYLRKISQGNTGKEALRCLKRRISDAIYRHLMIDAHAHTTNRHGPERTPRDDLKSA